MPLAKPAHPLVRAARFFFRALLTAFKVLVLIATMFFPIPIFLKPKVPDPDRRNIPAQVRHRE